MSMNNSTDFLMVAAIEANVALLAVEGGDLLRNGSEDHIPDGAIKWIAVQAWKSAAALMETMPLSVKRDLGLD
jgi:hypothetical protein